MPTEKITHETVERVLTTEPNRILNAMPDTYGTQRAKALIKEASEFAHREVESVEMAEKGAGDR